MENKGKRRFWRWQNALVFGHFSLAFPGLLWVEFGPQNSVQRRAGLGFGDDAREVLEMRPGTCLTAAGLTDGSFVRRRDCHLLSHRVEAFIRARGFAFAGSRRTTPARTGWRLKYGVSNGKGSLHSSAFACKPKCVGTHLRPLAGYHRCERGEPKTWHHLVNVVRHGSRAWLCAWVPQARLRRLRSP